VEVNYKNGVHIVLLRTTYKSLFVEFYYLGTNILRPGEVYAKNPLMKNHVRIYYDLGSQFYTPVAKNADQK
jgi:hypothetical protein